MGLAEAIKAQRAPAPKETQRHSITTIDDLFKFGGQTYPLFGSGPVLFTQNGQAVVEPSRSLVGYAEQIYKGNGPVAALIFVRQSVFSTVEFKWQNLTKRNLHGDDGLGPLERPWPGGTTQNLLAKALVDADTAGNSYWRKVDGGLDRLRPDWVDIVLEKRLDGTFRKFGYVYYEGGKHTGQEPTLELPADEVAHFMPLQDPTNPWRGMSWLTPVLREVMVDEAAETHQRKFFEQGATLNLAVTVDPTVTFENFKKFKEEFQEDHAGAENAYKALFLGGGADITPVSVNLADLDLKGVQGGIETRLAAAAGVPPVVVGFREGMQGSSLNAGNYGQARRRFSDGTLHPLWMEAAGSFARLVRAPSGSRLWFDTRHVPFLREDAKDEAEIRHTNANTVRQLTEAGYTPDSIKQFVASGDPMVLEHTGMSSVQLQPPAAKSDDDRMTVPITQAARLIAEGWTVWRSPESTSNGPAPAGSFAGRA